MQNKRENFIIEMKKIMQKYNATITDSGFSDTTICISFKDDPNNEIEPIEIWDFYR